jgi:hypothetical protein
MPAKHVKAIGISGWMTEMKKTVGTPKNMEVLNFSFLIT